MLPLMLKTNTAIIPSKSPWQPHSSSACTPGVSIEVLENHMQRDTTSKLLTDKTAQYHFIAPSTQEILADINS